MRPLHEELADELHSLYKFLITLYIPQEALKVPPREGWPDETIRAHFEPGAKDEAVIKVMKHIPYIQRLDSREFQIWDGCTCNDFSGSANGSTEPMDEEMDDCGWPALEMERGKHVVTLGPCNGRNGIWIFCDVRTREIIFMDFQVHFGTLAVEDSPSKYVEMMKEEFRNLKAFPDKFNEIKFEHRKEDAYMRRVRGLFEKHGWPTKSYNKEQCLAELAEL